METHLYICKYCKVEYKPKKRGRQKFCSTSCRVNSHKQKKKLAYIPLPKLPNEENHRVNSYEEKVNAAGILNSALGAGAVEITKAFFTSPDNKPATKKDIQNILSQVQERYRPVKNMTTKPDGTMPFYDMVLKTVLYLPVR